MRPKYETPGVVVNMLGCYARLSYYLDGGLSVDGQTVSVYNQPPRSTPIPLGYLNQTPACLVAVKVTLCALMFGITVVMLYNHHTAFSDFLY